MAFQNRLEENLAKLQAGLASGRPDIGNYRYFRVFDPKPRRICAAAFPERVLHHAIMNVCEPALESYAIFDSYACRKGKGQQKAVFRAQSFARKFGWYLKLDIKKYFDSIDHMVALRLLARRFRESELLLLFARILDTYHTNPGKGVPIGNLISQHLANFYLGGFDHWIKEIRKAKGYLRYMDDMIVFGNEKPALKRELFEIEHFLENELSLGLKANVQLNRCSFGIPFLGYRVYPHKIMLSPQSKRRFARKFVQYETRCAEGRWTEAELARHMEPLIAFTKIADAGDFRKNVIQRYGVPF